MDITVVITGVSFTIGAGAASGIAWLLFRRALRASRDEELPDNGSKPDPNAWLEDLRSRVTKLESRGQAHLREIGSLENRLITVEGCGERLTRLEEDLSSLESDVRNLRHERKSSRKPL